MGNDVSVEEDRLFYQFSEEDNTSVRDHYDVIVVGSGYGGAIAACRAARSGQSVCLLERGRELLPGHFPEAFEDAAKMTKVKRQGHDYSGDGDELFDLILTDEASILKGCGLGGSSLINAGVWMQPITDVFSDRAWPRDFRLDLTALAQGGAAAEAMLRPAPYPKDPKRHHRLRDAAKTLQKGVTDIEDLDEMFKHLEDKELNDFIYKAPLCVNFGTSPVNHIGVAQPECNACGNCIGGCNTGAKNTLNMNYIADAKYHGAQIFVGVTVLNVEKLDSNSTWKVRYRLFNGGHIADAVHFTTANFVILAGGSLGSTEVLLRSREAHGLLLSPTLGKTFFGKGDDLGYSFRGDKNAGAIATAFDNPGSEPPGPSITSVVDMRSVAGQRSWLDGLILQDGGCAMCAELPFRASVAVDSDTSPNTDPQELAELTQGKAFKNTLPMLTTSHGDSDGELVLDKNGIDVKFKPSDNKRTKKLASQAKQIFAQALGGNFREHPHWKENFRLIKNGHHALTVSPLGGAAMGESGYDGVVNHKGQVFIGDSGEVHAGLYVVDGATVPRSLGVHPIYTICSLAERCMRLMAQDHDWELITYSFHPKPVLIDWSRLRKPGISATIGLVGNYKPAKDNSEDAPMTAEWTLSVNDLPYLINADPNRMAAVTGELECKALSGKPLKANGTVQLDVQDIQDGAAMNTYYRLHLADTWSMKRFYLAGRSFKERDPVTDSLFVDETKILFNLYAGDSHDGEVIGTGLLEIGSRDLLKFVKGIKMVNIEGGFIDKSRIEHRFYQHLLPNLWKIYSPFEWTKGLTTEIPPRRKRRLDLVHCDDKPEVHRVITADMRTLYMTRYHGGTKGPVLLIHGLGCSSGIFTLDTIRENLVEHLVRRKYDVWLADWRASACSRYVSSECSLDDVIKFDVPAFVAKIFDVTEKISLQVIGQGIGALVALGSMLRGDLDGKIRSLVVAGTSLKIAPSESKDSNGGLFMAGNATRFDLKKLASDGDANWVNKLIQKYPQESDAIVGAELAETGNPVVGRLVLLYGRQWLTANMNRPTLDSAHQVFTAVQPKILQHLAEIFKHGHLVEFKGKDTYLPKLSKEPESDAVRERLRRLDVPVCFLRGADDHVVAGEGVRQSVDLLTAANPEQIYRHVEVPDYGHLDLFVGDNASSDIYPRLVEFLELHAVTDKTYFMCCARSLQNILRNIMTKATEGQEERIVEEPSVTPTQEIYHSLIDNSGDNDVTLGASDTDIDPFLNLDLDHSTKEPGNTELPTHLHQIWARKGTLKCPWKEPPYRPPAASDAEDVVIVPVEMLEDQAKRDIYVFGAMHLGSTFSRDIQPRTEDLMERLCSASDQLHTVVMNGSILEMWHGDVIEPPMTTEQYLELWRSGEVSGLRTLIDNVKFLATEKSVKVYYVRGSHDHEVTPNVVEELFGDSVTFIAGALIYEITQGKQVYRVRFEHGHQQDLFDSYALGDDNLVNERPIGYYAARYQHTGLSKSSFRPNVLLERLPPVLEQVESDVTGSFLVRILSATSLKTELTKALLEGALHGKINADQKFPLDAEGNYITARGLCNYSYITAFTTQKSLNAVFAMLKYAAGDMTDFIRTVDEDVVVTSHYPELMCTRMRGRRDDVLYSNTGSWIGPQTAMYSYTKIVVPWNGGEKGHGAIEVHYSFFDAPQEVADGVSE